MRLIIKSLRIIKEKGVMTFIKKVIEWKNNRNFQKSIIQKEWDKALIYCQRLAFIYPEKIEYNQRIARCLKELGKDVDATLTMKKGFNSISSLNEVMNKLNPILHFDHSATHKYMYMGGDQNLGCIEHSVSLTQKKKKYLTKISTLSIGEKERFFYLEIYNTYPEINEITPRLLNYTEWPDKKLSFITMEKIEGALPVFNKEIIGEVIKTSKIISSIRYEKLKERIPNPHFNEDFILIFDLYPRHPINALHSFSSIHLKSTNEQLFQLMYKRMEKLKYSSTSFHYIKRIENLILQKNLYKKIKPLVHYSLQHGDFQKHNMILDKSGKLYVIDWGNMRIGPRWVDIAGFLGQLKESFPVIKDDFLLNQDISDHFDLIEKVFFIYTLIVTWFIVFSREEFEGQYKNYHEPAIECMEWMAQNIVEYDHILIG